MGQCCRISYSLNVVKMGLHSIILAKDKAMLDVRTQKIHTSENNIHDPQGIKRKHEIVISLNWALMNFSRSASSLSRTATLCRLALYSLYRKYPLPKTPTVTKTVLLYLLQKFLYPRTHTKISDKKLELITSYFQHNPIITQACSINQKRRKPSKHKTLIS